MKEKILPKRFPKNGVIGLVAPSSALNTRFIALGIKEISKRYNVEFVLGKTVENIIDSDIAAASVSERAKDVNRMFEDDKIDAIITVRGGYGSQHILDYLDYDLISKHPKPIVGFSDTTALLNAITVKTGMITFLGPTIEIPDGSKADLQSIDFLFRTISEPRKEYDLQILESLNLIRKIPTENMEVESGVLYGGNLLLTTRLIGTEYQPPGIGSIIALEDVSESAYTIDGMIHHLQMAGVITKTTPVIFGEFVRNISSTGSSDIGQEDTSPSINRVLFDRFKNHQAPVLSGLPFSHGEWNLTLPLGAKIMIDPNTSLIKVIENVVQ